MFRRAGLRWLLAGALLCAFGQTPLHAQIGPGSAAPPDAGSEPADPEPAPTNAAQVLQAPVTVDGWGQLGLGDTPSGRQEAYQAAVLDAYQQLLWRGAEQLDLAESTVTLEARAFRVDEGHPNPALLDWVLRSEVLSQQVSGGRLKVTLQSPPLADLNADVPHFVRSEAVNVDSDAAPETLAVTYDGRVQVWKNNALLASSPVLNTLACQQVRYPGKDTWEQVQLSRVLGLSSPEPVGRGKLRVVAELTLGEAVDGRWVGKAREQREVLLRWDEPSTDPQIELTEPRDFSLTSLARVPWKGLLRVPSGLSSARLRVNGRPFWQTPEMPTAQRLRMDIVLPLLPGVNRAQVTVVDAARRSVGRELLLYRNAPCPGVSIRNRRALLIGVDQYAAPQFPRLPSAVKDVERLKTFLVRPNGGAFAPEFTRTLSGSGATRAKILEALRDLSHPEGEGRSFLLIYFAGLSSGGQGVGGKSLLPYDARGFDEGALSVADLAAAVGDLRQQDVLLVADSSSGGLTPAGDDRLWLDAQEFADSLARQGWAVISSLDGALSTRDSDRGSRLLSAFLEGCSSAADGNADGFVEWDEAYRHLFQTLRISSPGTSPPLRRGELLGRVPLSVAAPATP